MTITSFDSEIPMAFIKEPSLNGRLMIFLSIVVSRVLKRELTKKERDNISFIVLGKEHLEVKYSDNYIGVIKLVPMTKDFIFTQ